MSGDVAARLEVVQERIEAAARLAGRKVEEIRLVAVTKGHPLETVIAGYQAGLRHFGENRAQEYLDKATAFSEWLKLDVSRETIRAGILRDEAVEWHFIGHLQSRQAGLVLAGRPGLIHSVDSLKLAERLDRLAGREGYPPVDILLQCNVSGEEMKSGFELKDWPTTENRVAAFLEAVYQIASFEKIVIRGLMTMAPLVDEPERARPTFQSLAALRTKLKVEMPHLDWGQLSMGMSDDFEIAIEEGATLIRVGRAIFGEREEI